MCGICGIVRCDGQPVDRAVLREMNDKLVHRGPDDEGFFVDDRNNGPIRIGLRGEAESTSVEIPRAEAPAVLERLYRAVAPAGYVERLR